MLARQLTASVVMTDSTRSARGASATLRLLLEATPVPPGFEGGATPYDVDGDALLAAFERMREAREKVLDSVAGSWDVTDPVDVALLTELNERDQLWRRALNEALAKMTSEQLAAGVRRRQDD